MSEATRSIAHGCWTDTFVPPKAIFPSKPNEYTTRSTQSLCTSSILKSVQVSKEFLTETSTQEEGSIAARKG